MARVHHVAATIAGKAADRKAALDRPLPAANKFIDLIFVPTHIRAHLGDDATELARAGARRVDEAVELWVAAGWL